MLENHSLNPYQSLSVAEVTFVTYRKIDASDSVNDDEDVCIGELLEAEIHADCKQYRKHKQG